jgi:selenium metabolism protein YedF
VTRTVDARGLACPQPVILTRKALQEGGGPVTTIVDNDAAERNVTRMAEKAGHTVAVEKQGDDIYLHIAGDAPAPQPLAVGRAVPASGPLVLVVSSEFMGRGEHEELGHVLVRAFFHTLGEVEPVPDTIVFFNSGVKLAVEGSPVVEDLQALADRGIEILACGTCLDYYGLMDKLAVGEVSNMYSIAEILLSAAKTVNL